MNALRIQLSGLRVDGPKLTPAELPLFGGLNVITGASDTGKTYICGLVDYLLGASKLPDDNPMSQPYERALLGLGLRDGVQKTVCREFRDDSVKLFDCPLARYASTEPFIEVSSVHQTGSTKSLSHFLLSQIDLTGRQVRRNKSGEKSSLTFRHVAHLVIVDEERIISKISPALSGQWIKSTEEQSVFRLFLTGAEEVTSVSPNLKRDERTQLQGEQVVLQNLLDARVKKLNSIIANPAEIDASWEKVSAAIQDASAFVAATREKISLLENNRADQWNELQKAKSRRLYLNEQAKRLELLREFYVSDRARLMLLLEAGHAYQAIDDGKCAVCGSVPEANGDREVDKFQLGCSTELAKIEVLQRDLEQGQEELKDELAALEWRIGKLDQNTEALDRELQTTLRAQNEAGRGNLSELIAAKERLIEARGLATEVAEFTARLAEINQQLVPVAPVAKTKKPATSDKNEMTDAFCAEVAATLKKWKFPFKGAVQLDPESCDLVIDDQKRGSFGKGYRALTHAAFTVSLMRHCRQHNIPHPGFVLLDTPLNPLRGPDGPDDTKVNDDMKRAFFEDLVADKGDDQIIVFENSEPPAEIRGRINYVHFSRNLAVGRYGFFPRR
jgi:hypothetical protein